MQATRNDRLAKIERLLFEFKSLPISDILSKINAASLEKTISKRTLNNDLRLLVEEECISYDSKSRRYKITSMNSLRYCVLPKYANSFLQDLIALQHCESLWRLFGGKNFDAYVDAANQETTGAGGKRRALIFWDDVLDYQNIDLIGTAYQLIKESKVIEFDYHPFDGEEKKVVLHAFFLKEYEGRWYICGMDEARQQVMSNFAIDRISNLGHRHNDKLKPMPKDWEDYYEGVIGMTVIKNLSEETIAFRVKNSRAQYVKTKPLHASQKSEKAKSREGWEDFTITVRINYELVAKLLSFGEDLELLSPYHNVKEMQDKVRLAMSS